MYIYIHRYIYICIDIYIYIHRYIAILEIYSAGRARLVAWSAARWCELAGGPLLGVLPSGYD